MAYQDRLNERQMSAFQELYQITQGAQIYYYTSGLEQITFGGKLYYPRAINRSDFSNTTKMESLKLTLTTTIDDQLRKFLSSAPLEPILLKITRVFLTSLLESSILFEGEAIDFTFKDNQVQVIFESRTRIFQSQCPKVLYQASCNHFLFDDGCTLDEDDYKVESTLSSVSGITLTSTVFSAFANGYFTGGYIKVFTDYRMITNHVGNEIKIQVPFTPVVGIGSPFQAFPGCDLKPTTCKTKFSNFVNFVGFPYIPTSNPILWGMKP